MSAYLKLIEHTATSRQKFIELPLIQEVLRSGASKDLYLDYLGQAYHHVKCTAPLLALAAGRCGAEDRRYQAALFEYVKEEYGREFDFNAGLAWNYFDRLELRASAYSAGNLNRGLSLTSPSGFTDGVLLENRYYFGSANIYDVSRLDFISVGYYPSKSMVGGDGSDFHPGLFARAYLTYDIPIIRSYIYGDAQFTAERYAKPRLIELDGGFATRPFTQFENLEFGLGNDVIFDLQANITHDLAYGAVRIGY